jgi:magnesium transporter
VQFLASLDRQVIAGLLERNEFFWLDLERPGTDDIALLGEIFGFHELALEDSSKFGQRPKLDPYGDYAFIVFFGARPPDDGEVPLVEVHLYVSGSYVITLREGPCDDLAALAGVLGRHAPTSEEFVVYKVFDALTDSFFPVLSGIDDEIDELEDALIAQPSNEQLHRIFGLKRRLVLLRKVVTPQRDMFARAIDQLVALPGLETEAQDYFRDVYDHLIRASDMIDSYRDLLTGAMDVYLSTVSNRLNQVMKQLTIIATIFLPLTFVTGFFGQNFKWMVQHVDTFGAFLVFGMGGLLVPIVVLMVYFRRRRFI